MKTYYIPEGDKPAPVGEDKPEIAEAASKAIGYPTTCKWFPEEKVFRFKARVSLGPGRDFIGVMVWFDDDIAASVTDANAYLVRKVGDEVQAMLEELAEKEIV